MDKKSLDVIIIGGSLAGLMHGIVLVRLGHKVRILERSTKDRREEQAGAGIGTGMDGKRFFDKFDDSGRQYSFDCPGVQFLNQEGKVFEKRRISLNLSSWSALYYRLRWLFDGLLDPSNPTSRLKQKCEGKAIFELGKLVTSVMEVEELGQIKVVCTDRSGPYIADLVIDASGYASNIRKQVLGDVSQTYSGFVGFRGTVPQTHLSDSTVALFEAGSQCRFTLSLRGDNYVIGYLIPGQNGSVEKGERLMNFVWYKMLEEGSEAWKATMTGKDGKLHHTTLPTGYMSDTVWQTHLKGGAETLDPVFLEIARAIDQPFIQAVRECLPRQIRFFNDKLLLVGESACLAYPTAGVAFNSAAISAFALERIMKGEISVEQWENEILESRRKWAAISKAAADEYFAGNAFHGEPEPLDTTLPT